MKYFILFACCFVALNSFGQVKTVLPFSEGSNEDSYQIFVEGKKLSFENIGRIKIDIQDRNLLDQHFPYPFIFIHGLTGDATTWEEFKDYAIDQGWSYGGQLKFCLNSDNNLFYSNLNSSNTSDVDDLNSTVSAADFYIINFDVDANGTTYPNDPVTSTQSNQAAIVKQGLAVSRAVELVLNATGKNKVILFGHSMGGLAAREYIQNVNLWQSDGEHHIAKLVTSGTPHGGSNATGTFIVDAFNSLDERSDAVRDLRRTYTYSQDSGVFLFSGIESLAVIDDNLAGFYNIDVNCNGSTGNQISGLNTKNIYTDIDYSCIIGDWLWDISIDDSGDGIVEVEDAQIKNFYNIISETFTIESNEFLPSGELSLHTVLPEYTGYNYYGFDEPDYYNLSYEIEKNTVYNGFITSQAEDAEYDTDYDDFVFTTTQPGWISVMADNIITYPFGISILGHPNYNYLYDQEFQSDPIQTQVIQLPAGKYYLEFYADAIGTSWNYPYNFKLVWNPSNPTATNEAQNRININITPNPTANEINILIENYESAKGKIRIQNEIGQVIYSTHFEGITITEHISLAAYPDGIYFVTVYNEKGSQTSKIVKKG